MPDNNHIVRAHQLRALADQVDREGLGKTFVSILRGETSISEEDALQVGAQLAHLTGTISFHLRHAADRLEGAPLLKIVEMRGRVR